MTKASSKVKTPSRIYWEKRESQNLQSNLKGEEAYSKKVQSILEYTQDQIQKEINGFYTKYANKEGITMADAKQRVSSLDMAEYERKAEKYVAEKDFSDKANEEMRLYNATMKINRLELLKANIGLELVAGYDEMDKYMGEVLDERALSEIRRQAGILGDGVSDPGGTAKTIAGASYRGATYSERIWTHQAMLKSELDKLLTEGMMQGRNPKVLARHLTKTFGTSKYNAERLMRTELARVQTAAQERSYLDNGWTEFEFVSIGSACSVCLALDGKHFKVKNMAIAENAPPMHPNCRCSTAPYEGGEEYEKWINSYGEHGLSFEKWKERENLSNQWNSTKDNATMKKLLGNNVNFKTARMPKDEYVRAVELWKRIEELDLPQSEKEYVYEELDNNLTTEERESAIVSRAIGNYRYSAVNKGHNEYKIYRKEPINLIDSVLDEVLDFDWRSLW